MVMRFSEQSKPMILNHTNAKMLSKLYKTPYIEDWAGRKLQLYVAAVNAFGEQVDAIRVRPYLPKADPPTVCSDCKGEIFGYGNSTAVQVAQHTYQKYGKPLCADCAKKAAESKVEEDVLK
jgi:hypothetical protein